MPLAVTGELEIFIDWTVRCGWLQVASCNNEGCKTCASVAGLVVSFIIVVTAFSCKF